MAQFSYNDGTVKIALVYDRVNKWGGAERVLRALHELWPRAPLYTAVYDSHGASWAADMAVQPSFLQKIPGASTRHELLPLLTPLAFQSFSFAAYDVVISVTSADAKGIITTPSTYHICYCLTPTRYLWSGYETYVSQPGMGFLDGVSRNVLQRMKHPLRRWDLIDAHRPDAYVAISTAVASRIKSHYRRPVDTIIHPPVDTDTFTPGANARDGDYYLVVSRLVPYKRVDLIIDAFNETGLPLVVIGRGSQLRTLRSRANGHISFVSDHLTDEELVGYYQGCRAFVYGAEEDFGIVAAEAQAAGKPVIAYGRGGIADIVDHGKTGVIFDSQTSASLVAALKQFETMSFDPKAIRRRALMFSKATFQRHMTRFVASRVT